MAKRGVRGGGAPPIQNIRIMMHLNDKSLRLLTHNMIQRDLDGAQWSEAERSGVETVAAVGEQRESTEAERSAISRVIARPLSAALPREVRDYPARSNLLAY